MDGEMPPDTRGRGPARKDACRLASSAPETPNVAPPSPPALLRWGTVAGVGVYLLLSVFYVFALPVSSGPDECDHLRYIAVLRTQHRLPVLPRLTAGGQEGLVAEQAQHPPLYYAVLAVASAPFSDLQTPAAQRFLRLLSVLMGLGAVLALARLMRRVWPEDPLTACGALGVVCFLPNLPYLCAMVNNTAGAVLGSAIGLLLLHKALAEPAGAWRRWLAVGLALALAMLAKITALWLLPAALLGLLLHWRRGPRDWRTLAEALAALLLPALVLVGVWVARNYFSFGEILPERVLDRRYLPDGFAVIFFQPFALGLLLWVALASIPLSLVSPFWILRTAMGSDVGITAVWCLTLPAVVGLWRSYRRSRPAFWAELTPRRLFLVCCTTGGVAAMFIAVQALLHDWNTGLYAGRYALEAVGAFGVLWAAGLRALAGPRPGVRRALIGGGLAAWLACSLLTCYLLYHFPWVTSP